MDPESDDNLKRQLSRANTKTSQNDAVVMLAADASPQHRLSNSVNDESIDIEANESIEAHMLINA